MPNIRAMIANVPVTNLTAAIPFYQELAGVETVKRFTYGTLDLAAVGPFLFYSGEWGDHPEQIATVIVESVAAVVASVERAGGVVLEGPDEVPNGTRILAKHVDGSVFEYLQPPQQ